jgi:putative two-component system response regulator
MSKKTRYNSIYEIFVLSGAGFREKSRIMDDIFQSNILICDDSVSNIMMLRALLISEGFERVIGITDPEKVVPMLQESDFDLLILDIEMPVLDGFGVMESIENSPLKNRPTILVVTGSTKVETRNRALQSGAQDFINKPIDEVEAVLRARNLLVAHTSFKSKINTVSILEKKIEARTQELSEANQFLITSMALIAEFKDKETGKHVLRVGQYARILAEVYGLVPEICYLIEKAAPLHDLGKIAIPDSVLLKKGPLDKAERKVMDGHCKIGADILFSRTSMLVSMASTIALSHHERWDGAGYPSGLAGESIPIEGRITAIADVFDALTTTRPYKEAWTVNEAVAHLEQGAGHHFDPNLVALFIKNLESILEIKNTYSDDSVLTNTDCSIN